MTQLQLPIDLKETRRARIERIASILNGPPSGLVHRASVYFDERAFDEATARAQEEGVGGHRGLVGPLEPPPALGRSRDRGLFIHTRRGGNPPFLSLSLIKK